MFLSDLAEFKRGRKAKLTPIQPGDIVQHGYKNRITGGGYGVLGHGMTIRDDFARTKGYTTVLEDSEGMGKLGRVASVHHNRSATGKNYTDLVPRRDTNYGVKKRTYRTYKKNRGNHGDGKRKMRTIQQVENLPINPAKQTQSLPAPVQKTLPPASNKPRQQQTSNPRVDNTPKPQSQKTSNTKANTASTYTSSTPKPKPQGNSSTPKPKPQGNSSTLSKPKSSRKFLNKYSLGALGAAGVLGGGYLGYRAYQKRKKEGKK